MPREQLDGLEDWARRLTMRGILSYLDINLSGSGLIRGDHLAARLEKTLPTTASTICRSVSPPSPPNSTPATKSG